jgi:type II secretion system protein D
MKKILLALLFTLPLICSAQQPDPQILAPGSPVTPTLPQPAPAVSEAADEPITVILPKTSVQEVISFYETLTGKRIIRDSNYAGQELTIMVAKPVPRKDAIAIIESSLLLNNYSIVPVDAQTVKILGPARAPRTEGLPLLSEVNALPTDGDKVVSFYKPLEFVSPEEAITVIQGVVQINAFGSLVPVPNTNAIIMTDKTPVIRRAIGILELIDVEPARVVTEFIALKRANSERVVEILDEMFGKEETTKSGSSGGNTPPPAPKEGQPAVPAPASGGGTSARYENRLLAGKAKFVADKRTNRILVVTRTENYRYVKDVIAQLDSSADFEEPYVRVLDYVPVDDIFPVLSDMLAEKDSEQEGGTGGGANSSNQSKNSNPLSNSNGNSRNSNDSLSGGDGLSRPDRLTSETEQGAPQSVTLGEIRLIADNNSNSVIVFGPPESKLRAKQILQLLDQRPKQVYLAVVIGQLRLDKGMEYGVSYLIRNNGGIAGAALSPSQLPGIFPDPGSIVKPDSLTPALSALSGLTVYGTIADSVDVFARFLENTNRFRTLSRPVIYTTNNRKATILSGQKVPVPTQSLTSATGFSANGSSITSNIQYQDVVLKLEVIPLINSDREVNLVIAQTNDNIIGKESISGNEVPIIATQEITTSVRVPNGATIVLGGLISEDKERNVNGIPYISQIPVLGTLLGGRTENKIKKSELIVMIQPVVVESNGDMMKGSAYEADRTPLGRDGQEITAPIAEQVRPSAPWKPTPVPPVKEKKKFRFPWSNDQHD